MTKYICVLAVMVSLSLLSSAQAPNIPKDPQAMAIVAKALAAMAPQGVAGYLDSKATGRVTVPGTKFVNVPIVLESKGTREMRSDLQITSGTITRILNNGEARIQRPDGTVRHLLQNNILAERVSYIPIFSLLAEYQGPDVSVENLGTTQLNGRLTQVIALRPLPIPGMPQNEWDRTTTKTQFYVDALSGTITKMAYLSAAETNPASDDTVEIYLSDYQAVDGLLVPFRQTEYHNGNMESDMTLNSVAFNVGVSDSDFALPQ